MLKMRFPRRLIIAATFLFIALLTWYCHRDPVWVNGNPENPPQPRTDCAAYLSYEDESTTYGKLVNPSDASLLKPEDLLLLMPHRERYRVEACYKSDGSDEITITYLKPENPIVYADSIANAWYQPDYSKVVMKNNQATYYDQYDAVMRTGSYTHDQGIIDGIVQAALARQIPSEARKQQLFDLLKNNQVTTESADGKQVIVRVNQADGSYSRRIIDKNTMAAVGQFDYDQEGKLQTRLLIDVDGTDASPVVKNVLFESRFKAISSDAIGVQLIKYSQISQFVFSTNQ
jgi:hypothetical protein